METLRKNGRTSIRTGARDGNHSTADEATEKRLLTVIYTLALELRPHVRGSLAIDLDSDLDNRVGLDSLGRAELLLRVDREFGVRLPDRLIAEAQTPRDLLIALRESAPDTAPSHSRMSVEPVLLPETEAPVQAATLNEVLATHVTAHGDRPHLSLWSSKNGDDHITYAALDAASRRVAQGLLNKGIERGDRVAIMLPTEMGFFQAFFGVLLAGGVPVPIYPPFRRAQIEDHLRRQARILRNAEASLLITNAEIRQVGVLLYGLADTLRNVETVEDLSAHGPVGEPVVAQAETTALIQYTSGSTGDPKGVVLTHANLLANIRAMGDIMEASSSDTFVSWLPLYHDMGLIGAWLGSLYFGARVAIMPPLAFLADPARWLWAIHRHRATLTAAPNFAYELCLKSVRDEDIEGLDLSTLRMMINGAEPVSPATIARFTERFARYGFRQEAFAPVYGLAESSVGLAFPPLGRKPIIDRVQRDGLSRDGMARPAEHDDMTALSFAACGRPLPGHEIRIVDESGREVAERHEGRLQFKGPSVTAGYFKDEVRTAALFDGDWLESGDRAYIAAGDIYLTGRVKDIIIRAGRNIYPHELEEFVGNIDGVRKGCVAAFSSGDPHTGTERLVVLAETRLTEDTERKGLRRRILEASNSLLGLPPDEIILAPPRTVPKTSSGKIRRSDARALFEDGLIDRKTSSLTWQIARLGLIAFGRRWRRAWRRSVDLAYSAWWWAALVAVSLIAWPLVVFMPQRDLAQRAVGYLARAFFRLGGIRIETVSEAPLPSGGVILACNHSSYLDGAAITAAIPGRLSFIAKEELARQRVAGPFLRRLETIFVRRTDVEGSLEDTAATLEAARAGRRIVSFPEGTLTRMPGLLGFRLGAFIVAAKTDIPVVPVTIRGTRSVLRGGQWFPRRGRISIRVGLPLRADGNDFEAAIRLRDAVRAVILEYCGEPDLARETVSL